MSPGGRITPDGFREIRKGKLVDYKVLGKNKVYFIYHALLRMKERGISEAEVFEALAKPDETGLPTQAPRRRVRKYRNRRTAVDVVYELKTDIVRVITAIQIQRASDFRKQRLAQRRQHRRKKKP